MKSQGQQLKEVARLFSRLGFTAFGGPAVHIALMQDEVVKKKQWMSDQHFLDLIGATNLIPGPNSTEMAIHIGQERAGWKGLIVAGLCFILPAVCITGIFAWLYKSYGALPQVQPFIYGIKPAILSVVISAIYPLAKKSMKTIQLGIIGLFALVLCLFHYNEIYILFGAGLFAMLLSMAKSRNTGNGFLFFPFTFLQITPTSILSVNNTKLFLVFLKIGAILYGSGYVLFAFLDSELVSRGLLTHTQLIDAIAVGQFTPGPVFSSVTFVGYQINGITGAIVSTIGVFLPSFLFVALLNPLVKRMRGSVLFSVFLDAVNVASIALILAICYEMGQESVTGWKPVCIAVVSQDQQRLDCAGRIACRVFAYFYLICHQYRPRQHA